MAVVRRALLVVDVQRDFVEGGSLGVDGGEAVAERVSAFLRRTQGSGGGFGGGSGAPRYACVLASRDHHEAHSDNGGHFPPPGAAPDFATTWPPHCVQGTAGVEYAPGLDLSLVTHHVRKGQGRPAYSLFEGATDDGRTAAEVLAGHGVTDVEVVGIATDHCVRASALDARAAGLATTVLVDLTAGVATRSTALALTALVRAGARLATSDEVSTADEVPAADRH
jgi:nicotinamidase/pyrazinamidase